MIYLYELLYHKLIIALEYNIIIYLNLYNCIRTRYKPHSPDDSVANRNNISMFSIYYYYYINIIPYIVYIRHHFLPSIFIIILLLLFIS